MFALVALHVAAFAFWCFLLWKTRRAKDGGGGSGGPSGSGSGAYAGAGASAVSGSGGSSGTGRSARDILRAYHKSSIGKG